MLFHHDNPPAHTSAIAKAKLFDLRYEILPHPRSSPGLAPSDYFLFPNMTTWLGCRRFSSNEEITPATNEYFEKFDKNYILERIKKHEYSYNKCLQLKGDYVDVDASSAIQFENHHAVTSNKSLSSFFEKYFKRVQPLKLCFSIFIIQSSFATALLEKITYSNTWKCIKTSALQSH